MRSLVWATSIDVLPLGRVVEPRDGYVVVRSPSNPTHYWGNLLIFDDAPAPGDADHWEARFVAEFGHEPLVRHRTFGWDRPDGAAGALAEFVGRGYDIDESVGLVAGAADVRPHPRENPDVVVRTLDPDDDVLWDAVVELQVAERDEGHDEDDHRRFSRARAEDLRELFRAGRGAWYAALEPGTGELTATCGVVVTDERGRFQAVQTAERFQRRGVASRLVVEAARRAAEDHGAEQLVIVADAGYHALGLYESLGFARKEHVLGVCRWPRAAQARDTLPR